MKLSEFQALNDEIYRVQNDRIYNAQAIVGKIGRYTGLSLKAIRKKKQERLGTNLVIAFSWTMALANKMHINLPEEIWKKFPGKCPYCTGRPCACRKRADLRSAVVADGYPEPQTIDDFQRMFKEIYPKNTLRGSIEHLAEEVFEVGEAVEAYSHTPGRELKWWGEVLTEIVDVAANIIAVANCSGVNLQQIATSVFTDGCPGCHTKPCRCGFTVADANVGSRPVGTP